MTRSTCSLCQLGTHRDNAATTPDVVTFVWEIEMGSRFFTEAEVNDLAEF